jgi:AsmA family
VRSVKIAMADKKGTKRNKLLIIAGTVFAVLVVVYFVVTSGAFIKGVVLPKVADALKSDLTVEDLSVSPFSGVDLKGVTLTPKGREVLVAVGAVRVRYSLFSILTGSPSVSEVTIDNPALTIVERADKTSNLSALLASLGGGSESKAPSKGETPKFKIQNVKISQLLVRQTSQTTSGPVVMEVTGLNLALDQAGNGLSSKLSIAFEAAMRRAADVAVAKARGEFTFALGEALQPQAASGSLNLSVGQASGGFAAANGLGAALSVDASASEVKNLVLAFSRDGKQAGKLAVSGPYDPNKKEARLSYEISGISREVMSLVGGAVGFDFGSTEIGSKGRIDVAQLGNLFAATGKLSVNQFSLGTAAGVTPKLDVDLAFKAAYNTSDGTLLLEDLTLTASEKGSNILTGKFDRPMNLALGQAQPGFREASYQLSVAGLRLEEWRPVAGPLVPEGVLRADVKLSSEKDGRRLQATADVNVDSLAWSGFGLKFNNLAFALAVKSAVEEFKLVRVDKVDGSLVHSGRPLVNWSGVAHYSGASKEVGAQVSIQAKLPEALAMYPVAGVKLDRGDAAVSIQVSQAGANADLNASVTLQSLYGSAAGIVVSNYQAQIDSLVKKAGDRASLERAQVKLQNGFADGGSVDANGSFNLVDKSGSVEFHVTDLNEKGLGPFLAGALGESRLVSAKLRGAGSASINTNGQSAKLDLKLIDLQLDGRAGKVPARPLSLGVGADVSVRGLRYDLKSVRLDLGATQRASNILNIVGLVDLTGGGAAPTTVTVSSDGLDLTPLYALASATKTAATNAPAPAKPAQGGPATDKPAQLPLKRADASLDIKRVYLGYVAISNWTGKVHLENGRVGLDPFQMTVNGAPVTAKADIPLEKPDAPFSLSFSAKALPVEPMVSTFATNLSGQIGGTMTATAALSGAGLAPEAYAGKLNGNVHADASALNFKLSNVQSGLLKTVANLIIGLPDLISSPRSFLGNVLTPGGGKGGGWVDQIQQAPIQIVALDAGITNGVVQVSQALAKSDSLKVNVPGVITLKPVITNSPINFTVDLGLQPALAKRIGLDGTGDYVSLPKDFVKIDGTLGAPKPEPDYAKIALLAGKGVLGVAGNTAAAVGNLVGIGGGTNTSGVGNLIKGVGNLLGGNTNKPAATNAPAQGFNPLNLLNGLGK